MKKFKLFFYSFYLILAVAGIIFSILIMRDLKGFTQEYLHIKNLSFITNKLPYYILSYLLVMSILMIIEFVFELSQIRKWKQQAQHAEEEILRLKAKLYDKKEQEEGAVSTEAEDTEESDEDDYLEGRHED